MMSLQKRVELRHRSRWERRGVGGYEGGGLSVRGRKAINAIGARRTSRKHPVAPSESEVTVRGESTSAWTAGTKMTQRPTQKKKSKAEGAKLKKFRAWFRGRRTAPQMEIFLRSPTVH